MTTASRRATPASAASSRKLRGSAPPEAHAVIVTAPGRGRAGRLRRRADGAASAHGQVPPHAALRLHARLQPQERPAADLRVEHPALGRAARRGAFVGSAAPCGSSCSTISSEGVLTPDIYDPDAEPALPRRARALRRRRAAVPRRRSRSQGQSRVGDRPHAGDAAQGPALRDARGGQAYLDRWEARWADTRIHGTTKRQVAAMFAEERPALLPLPLEPFRYYQLRHPHRPSRRLRRSRRAYYAAPPGWLGRSVDVQCDPRQNSSELILAPAPATIETCCSC